MVYQVNPYIFLCLLERYILGSNLIAFVRNYTKEWLLPSLKIFLTTNTVIDMQTLLFITAPNSYKKTRLLLVLLLVIDLIVSQHKLVNFYKLSCNTLVWLSLFQRVRNHSLTSLCLLTHHPFFSIFRECLFILKRLIDACNENSSPRRVGASRQINRLLQTLIYLFCI